MSADRSFAAKAETLRLMWSPLRAAGSVYQCFPLYHGLILQASHSRVSIFSDHAWSCTFPQEVMLSLLPRLPLSLFAHSSTSFSPPHFPPFHSLSSPFPFPHPSLSPSSSPLSLPCLFSSIWPHPCTKSLSCQVMHQERGSCELVRSEINKARTGWTMYPEKMHFVLRMGTAGHKSCHPGCLPGKARWSSSSLSSSSEGSKGLTVNSYVSRPITTSGTDKSILAGVMKGSLMHVHIWVVSMKYEWAVSYMSWQHTVDGLSYAGGTHTWWDELTISCWW